MRRFLFACLLFASGYGVCHVQQAPQKAPQRPLKPVRVTAPLPTPPAPVVDPDALDRAIEDALSRREKEAASPVKTIPADVASAIGARTWERTRAQGVQLARMCVNEDSRSLRRKPGGTEGDLTIDHRLIAQVVWAHRRSKSSFKGWLDVMRFLSPHVGRKKDPKRHRHDMHAHLPANGDRPPFNWIDCRDVDEGEDCDGDWRVHGPYWTDFRERVVDLWLTINFEQVESKTDIRPRKWGNEEDVIRWLKNHPDALCVLDMGEANFFLARPGEGCELNDPATVAARTGKRP